MTIQPFNHDGGYRGCVIVTHTDEEIFTTTTGEFLRDVAVCCHHLRERGVAIEPLPINLMPLIPKQPATVAADVMP